MTSTPPSWQPDPSGRHELRYWDGTQWTDTVADAGTTGTDSLSQPSAMAPQAPPPSLPQTVGSNEPQPQIVVVRQLGNGAAVTALVLGIIGTLLGLIPLLALFALVCGVIALVFGFIGRRNVKREPTRKGKGMAIAGIVLGAIAIVLSIIGFFILDDAFDDLDDDLNNSQRAPAVVIEGARGLA